MSETPYEPVVEPPDPAEAFLREDRAAAQAQAAALLGVAWHVSDEDDLIDPDVAEYLRLPVESPQPSGIRVPPAGVESVLSGFLPAAPGQIQSACFSTYRETLSPEFAAALFSSALQSPDSLVRTAAAAGYLEIGVEPERALVILREGVASRDPLVQAVARTRAAHVAPEIQRPELSFPGDEGPITPLETTLLIHGTFASRESWWRPGGDFHIYLLDEVFTDLYAQPDAFGWSGVYSEAARLLGANELVAWVQQRSAAPINLITHSHGGSVAMLASWAPLLIEKLVLLSCPVHRRYRPNFGAVREVVSVRVHCDLVILADRGGQRFRDPQINENVLPLWFNHSATHDSDVWRQYGVPGLIP